MVRIRLTRVGRRKAPFWRIVVADIRRARDGRFIEILGQYQPLFDPPIVKVDEERALYWLNQGAQPSDTVRSIFSKQGIMEKFQKAKLEARKAKRAQKGAEAKASEAKAKPAPEPSKPAEPAEPTSEA
jgi:small subunit ribosomal protein S16